MKNLHLSFALLTICGFIIRGIWMLRVSPRRHHQLTRIAPHVIDALFLATGIIMVIQMHLAILQNSWLLAKFAGLVIYIVLGAVALRHGRTLRVRMLAFVGALLAFAYIVGAAVSKSPLSWFA